VHVNGRRKTKKKKEKENLYLVLKMNKKEMNGLHA
jgi:hypothetical protein